MSLDIDLYCEQCGKIIHSQHITNNLIDMAEAAGLYGILWRPEENGIECAAQLIIPLREGITRMQADPNRDSRRSTIRTDGAPTTIFYRGWNCCCRHVNRTPPPKSRQTVDTAAAWCMM